MKTINAASRNKIKTIGSNQNFFRILKNIFLFLIAYWLYMDGVDTIIRMAVDYGISIGFKSSDLITALLLSTLAVSPADASILAQTDPIATIERILESSLEEVATESVRLLAPTL